MRSLFPWTEVSKAVQKPNGGQEVPEIALSVGSKLELLRAFVFAKCPYTSPYTHAFVRVCVYILYTLYMTEAPRVLHFSAFIVIRVQRSSPRQHASIHPGLVSLLFIPSLYSKSKDFSFTCLLSFLAAHSIILNFML